MKRPFIETRTTLLVERPVSQVEPPTHEQRLGWIRRTLVTNRIPPFREWREPSQVLAARVNCGRWVADCPECRGAEMADPDWPYFICCSCGAGPWRVAFPVERQAIERVLLNRPDSLFMSWEPGMTVAELLEAGPFHRSWTTPRTYVTGEIVTASILNTDHRDNLKVIESGSKGQHIVMNDAENAPLYVPGIDILDRDLTPVSWNNTTDEKILYSHEILAGVLGTTGGVRLTLVGTYLNSSAAARDLRFRIKLGATTVFDTTVVTIASSGDLRKWRMEVLSLNSAADAQEWSISFMITRPAAPEFVVTKFSGGDAYAGVGRKPSAEDTSAARTLEVTSAHSFAHVGLVMYKYTALLERVAA